MSRERPYTRRPGDRILRIPRARPWRVLLPVIPRPRTRGGPPLVLIYGFVALIALGTILLIMPVSSKTGQTTSFVDALFTATSAVCVTGLVVVDTADYWSRFGQVVILVLMQLGGFGFMTSATLFLLALGRRIGLRERLVIRESMGLAQLGGLVSIIIKMAIFTILVEVIGAVIFYFRFATEMPPGASAWHAIFHAISAFNNAGFDVFGGFNSISGYQRDPLMVMVTAVLIILGGISFLVIVDIIRKRRINRLSLDSKIVLYTTGALLILGTIIILVIEFADPDTLGALTTPQKWLNAFFQSVTARTAGFSTISMRNVADYALFFTMLLMFVGGASGSTAGGIKVNNFGMITATIWSAVRGKEHGGVFGREFNTQQVHRALAVVMLSLAFVSVVVFLLTVTEDFKFIDLLFETISAFGTVGLTTGIIPGLSIAGRFIITATMFMGRLGPLTLVLALVQRQQPTEYRYPEESVRVG